MSNYNHGHFLPEALEAILTQSYPPTELIIVDDGSTDNSVAVIERFAKDRSNVHLIRNSVNMGALHNSEVLFNFASGQYIYSTAADDRVLPGFFEKSIAALEQFPETALCFSDPVTFEQTGGPIRENRLRLSSEPCCFTPEGLAKLLERRRFQIAGHTSIIKRSAFIEAGGLLPQLKWHCDWFASWVLAFRYGACYVPEPLATLRISPNSFSAAGRKQWQNQIEILTEMLELLGGPYADVAGMFRRSAVSSIFGKPIIYAALRERRFWNHVTFRLIVRVLRTELAGLRNR